MNNIINWIKAKDQLPTKENADCFGKVWWCGETIVRLVKVSEILAWDFYCGEPWCESGHWAETEFPKKLQYPKAPNHG